MSKNMYDLTNPQKSIWLTNEFYNGTSIENVEGNVRILQKIDFDALKRAINLYVKRNDAFRLKFIHKDDTVMQYVDDFTEFDVEIVPVESEKDLKVLERSICDTPFETLNKLLFKFTIYRFPDGSGGFIINTHHLIADAWTAGLVVDEVMEHYEALINNKEIPNEPNLSYLDYINSEKEYLNSEKFKKDKEFWSEIFDTVPEIATIPSLNSENSKETDSSSGRKLFTIPKETISLINDFCRPRKASVFNFFMGVISLYLSRVSGLNEFVIGTPILNRGNFKEKQTSGMYISTIPFKVSLNSDDSFSNFLSNISIDFLKIFRHQKYPYQYLLEDLRSKDNNLPNLYKIFMSYQNVRTNKQTFSIPYDATWVGNNHISDDMDIHLYDMNNTGNISLAYDYLLSKYTIDDVCSIHSRILYIIDQILENNEIKLKDIEIVTPDEKRKILHEFNNTKVDYPRDKTIVQLFEEQVEKTPDNIAVVFGNEHLTYRELNERANSLAHYLRDNNIGRNDIVGIMVHRSLEMIISILAALKSGACYIPIDPEYPQDRIEYMLNNSNARVLLTFKKLQDKVEYTNKIFVDLDNDLYNFNKNNLENINSPNDLAYIIYTSGSTGMPKGVMLKHQSLSNLANYCNGYVEYLRDNKYRAIVSVTTVSFDIFVFETLISLQKGLKLVIANEQEQTIPRLLSTLIEKNNVEIIQTTPSRMQLLVNNITDIQNLSKIKYITLAGEQLPMSLVNELKEIGSPVIYNGYGPSETTVFSTLTNVTNHTAITIGRPLDNTQIYILNSNLNICPIKTPGEIYISGDGVGLGYLNNNELTKKSYIENPFSDENKILYKTGDLGYYRDDGEIICLGRCDNQVKIRGLRIELEEIENAILKFKNIDNCVVVKKVSNDGHEFLCAYFTSANNINVDDIRNTLLQKLPKYMVPQYFIKLDKIPYTLNGKVDRKKLPAPQIQIKSKEKVLPRNKIDENVIEILKDILHVQDVSINDSLFDLGGDSLTAINLCTKIYSSLKVQLFVKDILENPIVKNLSDLISLKSIDNTNISIPKAEKAEYYPTSSAQSRTYYSSNIAGSDSNLYNIAGGLILDKLPDINKLERAFNKLIEKQPSLRTYFKIENNQVVQKIEDKVEFKLNINSNTIKDNQIKSYFSNFVRPFDLSTAPLFRAEIVNIEGGKALLAIDMHHIISDGASLSVLVNSVCKLYNNEELPDLEIDYKDYSVWENNRLKSGDFQEAENYWINQFNSSEIPVLNLPTKPRPAVQSFEGDKIYCEIDKSSTEKINNLAKELGVTPYMILLSAYYILLSKYTSQSDIVVGTPVVNRLSSELHDIVGMFVNSLPLRANIDSKLNFNDFVNNIKDICVESYKYENYPLDELINKLKLTRDISRSPLFDTMFIYQNNGYTPVSFDGINAKYYIPNIKISKFDLSLEIVPTDDKLNLSFEYASKLFDEGFIKSLSVHYINILNAILENRNIKIADICMLSEDEKKKILYEFNDTNADYPKDKTIVQLFECQAEKNPNNIAVVFKDQKLTYKELNERANSLAHYLQTEGVKEGNIIPVIMDRSIDLIISMLSIIKLGAVYLPITTEYPIERVNYIIDDASASIIICNQASEILKNNVKTINLDKINYTNNSNSNLNIHINVNNPLYSIYTSGSTGMPKGVKISHKNLNNFISSFKKSFEVSANIERCLASTNISFDVSIWEFFFTLLNGFELHLFEDNSISDIFKYCDDIISHKISMLYIPPNILDDVFKILSQNAEKVYLNKLLVGVESIKTKTIEKYYLLNPNMKIVNGYGPSECTICSTAYIVTKENLRNYLNIPIGKPLSNLKLYILDKDQNPVPFNVSGELYICGDNVGCGYINNDEMNKKNFVQIPFFNEKAYKTGDIVKLDENCNLLFEGRQDNQVKINGHRIELDEITNTIYSYPYITKCVVFVNDKKLICYFTSDKKINQTDLLSYLQRKLPKYFIPNHLIQLDKFKLTSNGKIDMKYLKNLKIVNTNKYVAPKTDLQKELKTIFESVLGSTHIGITDDFFEIGGDSLSAIKLQIEAFNHGINISYKDIFSYPTIEQLSEKPNIEDVSQYNDNYDYSQVNNLISINTIKNVDINLSKKRLKNILLTGSTGFMGSHILENLLKNTNCNIYCIIRRKNNIDPVNRLIDTMNFYFNNNFKQYLYNRVFVLEGDITKANLGLDSNSYKDLGYSVTDVINAAAIVKHYGKSSIFNDINVVGTQNIIKFCNQFKCSLYHLSTLSVSGTLIDSNSEHVNNNSNNVTFNETDLFINQDFSNVYVRSKFLAERLILENILQNNLDAKIFRLGNITNRYSDGNFQINISENAFINKVFAFLNIGKFPNNLLDDNVEFTPVDLCADAIVKIISHKTPFNIFHMHNNNYITFRNLILTLENLGFTIEIVSPEDFYSSVKDISKNNNKNNIISGIINDFDKNKLISYKNDVRILSPLTDKILQNISFKWPIIDENYIQKYINYLKSIGYIKK